MKFSELREADLSKAQIKKVHDKADDLPKNDFIKRYGKEWLTAVRVCYCN